MFDASHCPRNDIDMLTDRPTKPITGQSLAGGSPAAATFIMMNLKVVAHLQHRA